jgi:uncharacterized repeat protein (TIGR01451 family)
MKSIAKSSPHRAENHRSRPVPLLVLSLALLIGLAWMVLGSSGHASEPPPRHNPEPGSEANPGEPSPFSGLSGPYLPIEPDLLRQVLAADPGAMHNIIVELTQQADLEQVSDGLSRTDRQAEIVSRLKSTAQKTQAELLTFLQNERARGKVDNLRPFWVFNGLAVTADGETLLAIAGRPEVRLVREDRRRLWVEPMSVKADLQLEDGPAAQWNVRQIGADVAWNTLGIDGTGTTVAIVDTGVDWQHPALQAQYRGYKPAGLVVHEGNWFCATDEGYLYPGDGHGHGTHVTGTAVGRQDADGVSIGVAPGAQWIAVKALDDLGYAYDSWIHAAFEWILAPGGDPSLAPDVVNSSWGYRNDQYEAFRPDVQALRAAGIVPVFSAGNQGPMPATLDSPASYPEALSVGATDDLDLVTSFSSRGPSPWGEIKPEIVAPGAQIRSSLPGGRYGFGSGTSMASPHVAGVAALILQAQPALSVDDVESILVSSARPLGDTIPNNDSGWGRVDAYQAAAVAAHAGFVTGQVTHLPDQQPLSTAQVTAYNHLGEQQATVPVDEMGRYLLALPEGIYEIEASAFGYKSYTAGNVFVQASASVTLDLKLTPAPAGVLWGEVRNAETGGPVSAQVSIEGTPAWTTSDPQTGQYSLALPAGTYTVTAEQNGYRRAAAAGFEVAVNQATRADFALTPAPTLLLVDSGRWYYGSQAAHFETALRDRDYVYDLWEIRDAVADRPVLADFEPYDLIVWSSPLDSPEMIRAGDVISDYLGIGGNLLISGQDVGFWDDGLSGFLYHPYVGQFLRAKVLADNAGREDLVGVSGEILDGLVLPINDPDSAGNQTAPDLIDLLDPQDARLIGEYQGVGGAALRASGCQSYRAVYLAAGLEGLGNRASRAEVLDRALTWLDSPHSSVETRLAPTSQESVWLGSPYITYTVELQNRGQSADRFDLELSPSAWPVSVLDGDFTQAITQSMVLGACQTQTVGVRIAVPPDAGWNATDVVTLTARSQSDPGVTADAVFSSKSPAPILLVDDHRWYDTSDRYRTALEARQLPYDVWSNAQAAAPDVDGPSLERLERYPVVVWFTAYDWFETLTPEQESALATYLDRGGRLLLSSQDYLYTSRFTDFARDYLGVYRYADDLAVTQTVGAVGDPVGQGLGPMDLVYPFRNFSDALRPSPAAGTAFWGQHGQPVALTKNGPPWKTAFYAFALEALGPSDMATVVGNTVDWLSPLGDSALAVDSLVTSAGAERKYTLTIRNTGPRPLGNASLSNPVPPYTTFVPGSLEGPAIYDPGAQSITWAGVLDPGQAITVTYRLEIDRPLPDGTIIENVAQLSDETGLGLERASSVKVDSPYLRGSAMSVSAGISRPGRVLTYTMTLRNDGLRPADARLTDRIPANSYHTPDSGWASSGVLTSTAHLLVWSGSIAAGNVVTITFPVVITPAVEGFYVYNRASLTDGWGDTVPLETQTLVETYLLLPLVLKGF